VKEQFDLSAKSALRLTIARYYTPIGRSIQRPYTNGEKAYYDEINNRYHDIETAFTDSVKNNSGKVFKTKGGKTVYAKGGIAPDYFIAMDTTGFNKNSAALYNKSTISRFAYNFYLENQVLLKSFKTPRDFINGFNFSEADWKQFTDAASRDSVQINMASANEKASLTAQIKSSIARQIWRTEGYFEVMNTGDEAIKKAMEILGTK